jgi:hypothetical protein
MFFLAGQPKRKHYMSSKQPSSAELYAYHFQNPEPKYYTRVPNIIDHLTYIKKDDNGNDIHMRLSIYAKELYRIIRMIASDHNVCWYNTKSLAEKVGCSVGSICNAKKELLMPMDQLGGNALVKETRKMKPNYLNGVLISRSESCTYQIVDIWPWNNAYMATIGKSKKESDSPHESDGGGDSPHESPLLGTDSPGEPIKNNKNPLFKEQQPSAKADSVVFKNEEGLFPSEEQNKAGIWLLDNGCEKSVALRFLKKYSYSDLSNAISYFLECMKKNRKKGKKTKQEWAYLQTILNNRYWEKKTALS